MNGIPNRLPESGQRDDSADDYPVDPEARALRERLEEEQGLPRGLVASYSGRLVLGRKKNGMIYEEGTGRLLGADPHPQEAN